MKDDTGKKQKTIVLFPDNTSQISEEMKRYNCNTYSIYSNQWPLIRVFRRLHTKSNLPFQEIWYGNWTSNITDNSTVILFDSILNVEIINWISNCSKNVRIIFWFWNPVNRDLYTKLKEMPCELWSFDPADCEKYGLKYNTQFYFDSLKIPKNATEYDVLFVGKDKGRLDYLNDLRKSLEERDFKPFFHVVSDSRWVCKPGTEKKSIPYSSLLHYVGKSKAIIDIVQRGQKGLTLRAMEALFFEKKLITNNRDINRHDFYDRSNIFIMGQDNIEQLPEFLNSPYAKISQKIVARYNFDSWINRFFD